jgi:hypothetical protein
LSPYTKEALEAQAAHWQQEAERQRRLRFNERIVGLIALGALISFNIWYTGYTQSKSDASWCAFLVPLDARYQSLETKDPDALTFARQLHELVQDRGCSPRQESPSRR